jgi:hypothetical protein
MYNLTVDQAHKYFVGQQQWLVHNAGCSVLGKTGQDVFNVLMDGTTTYQQIDNKHIYFND